MYTEIRELINFLARYFHLRIPRLKIGMFCEHMANNCLFRFQPYWNINQPKQHEEQRIIRISRAFCDETFTSAASSVGLLQEELLNCLPDRLILYVNPGEVFYCSCDYSPPVPIWLGSVNEDLSYNEQKASGHTLIPPLPLPSSILPPMSPSIQPLNSLFSSLHSSRGSSTVAAAAAAATSVAAFFANGGNAHSGSGQHYPGNLIAPRLGPSSTNHSDSTATDFTVLDWRVNLSLVHPRELGYECTNPYAGFLMFRYIVLGTPNFTVETFAFTRFGSFRKRPEHEKKFVDAIKDFVNSATTTTESNSATTTSTSARVGGIWSNSNEGLWMMSDELKQLNF